MTDEFCFSSARISKTPTKTSLNTVMEASSSVPMITQSTTRSRKRRGVDGHMAVTHSDTYVIGDAHTNTCENRHSFLRQWLAKFRGVSKHHLQRYLNFLELKLNEPDRWFEKLLCYNVSG